MQLRKPATAILALALSAGLAQADDAAPAAGSTLDKIAKNGVIVVGHRESSVPFSYYDNQQKVVGYSQDYSNAIVEAVKKKLNKPDLQVKLIPITSQNRIPLLQNGTFDFECGSTTNNVERQKQAAFSDTIFVVGTRLLTKKGGDIKDFADLKGKRIGMENGTTHQKYIQDQHPEVKTVSYDSYQNAFIDLKNGRIDGVFGDTAVVNEWLKTNPQLGVATEKVTDPQYFGTGLGIAVRPDNKALLEKLNNALAAIKADGTYQKINDQWFPQ